MKDGHLKKISNHLSEIPDGWSIRPLSKVVKIANGQVDPLKDQYRTMPHVGPENIESGSGRISNIQTAEILGLKSGKYLFDKNALVYSKIRPNLNKVCMPGFDGLCSADAYPMWAINGISLRYLFYYLLSELFVHQAVACSMRTGMPKINREDLNSLWVICPPEKDQEVISEILIKWDHAIDETERLLAAKQERRTWLMQQLLTGKRRLPGHNKLWQAVLLGDVFTNRIETNFHDLPLVAITGSGGVVSREDLVRRDTSNEDKSKYLRICPGDIGYNTMRMWQGVCGLSQLEGIVSPAYTIATPKEGIDGEFMALLFKSLPVIHLFHRHSQGLVDDTLNLKWRHFAEINVTIPEKIEQQAIATVFRTADRELELLRSQLDALKEQKKGLMQQLLTGKISVQH